MKKTRILASIMAGIGAMMQYTSTGVPHRKGFGIGTRGSINGQMSYRRDRKHGTMSRRIARNQVMGRHTY